MPEDYDSILEREIVSTRVLSNPKELVYRAWVEPEHLQNWWGPRGFTNTFHEFDLRPGGYWRFIMHGPDKTDYPNEIRFVEIRPCERLVFEHISAPKFRLTALFEDVRGSTKVTFRQLFASPEDYQRLKAICLPSNEENLDKLEAEVARMIRSGG